MKSYKGRLGIIQRVLPSYRAPFFDLLAEHTEEGLSVFAGNARPSESIKGAESLKRARHAKARNLHFLSGPFYLCWQLGLTTWLKEWNPDALIVEANPRYLSTARAVHWMHTRGRPVIGWGLGAPAISGSFAALRRARRATFLRPFDALIAYSQPGAEEYRDLGFPDKRIFVAPNAVANIPKTVPPKRSEKFSGPAIILFVGRLQARKGLDRLLKACALLPEKVSPHCLIVGEGPERQTLEALARKIYPKAEFLGGRYGPDLDKIFAQADLFVLPGTGGLAIQQAMAHALPIIVAQGDGTQEDLVGSSNGWLLATQDVSELARTIEEALTDPLSLRKKGRESLSLVKERYNLQTMTDVFIQVLNQITT